MYTNLRRIQKDIEELSKYNSTPGKGLTRFSLTEADKEAREYLKNELSKLDLEIYEDAAGSLFGKKKGTDENAPSIIIGSHFDSVKNGGNFDGPAGVVMALEIMRTLKENGVKTKYPIEFVAMIEEEGGRFGGGVFGSRAMIGNVTYNDLLELKDDEGISMAEAFTAFGFDPKKIESAKRYRKDVKAFLELHIEQGPVLEKENIDVGLVDFIVGINEFRISIKGRPDHAGTTPMNMRKDALVAASEIIMKINQFAIEAKEGTVATVGVLNIHPGAANIVPGEVQFTVDIRSRKEECIREVKKNIELALKAIEEEQNLECNIREMLDVNPVKMSSKITDIFEKKSIENNFSYKRMTSGAGHDAMIMASLTDVGLIFVPSKDGRSHCPEEWTDYDRLQKGIELIYNTVLELGEAE